jgi:MoaA/NifB/PqqE/SkfB family radical SAM enzyme
VMRGSGYQTGLQLPAWPSAAFDAYAVELLTRSNGAAAAPLPAATLSITHRCSPQCNPSPASLATQELSLETLRKQLERLQQEGVRQLTISGGEPMLRYPELLELLQTARGGTDFWLATSGWELSPEKARALKEAGLLGIVLNLDHNDPEKHNALRADRHSFGWVMRAAESARKANLLLCFTLCPTPQFVSKENLLAYGRLAKNLGASFIQILEPLPAATNQPKVTPLSTIQISLLERFAISINQEKGFSQWPLISYQGGRRKQPAPTAQHLLRMDGSGNISSCSHCKPKPATVSRDRASLGAPISRQHSRQRTGNTTPY